MLHYTCLRTHKGDPAENTVCFEIDFNIQKVSQKPDFSQMSCYKESKKSNQTGFDIGLSDLPNKHPSDLFSGYD